VARRPREEEETGGAVARGGGRDWDKEGRGQEEEIGARGGRGGGRGDRRGGGQGRSCSDLEVRCGRTRRLGSGRAGAPAPATPDAVAWAAGSAVAGAGLTRSAPAGGRLTL
jgi:hypothetical protein